MDIELSLLFCLQIENLFLQNVRLKILMSAYMHVHAHPLTLRHASFWFVISGIMASIIQQSVSAEDMFFLSLCL